MIVDLALLKTKFENGDTPTETDFKNMIDSLDNRQEIADHAALTVTAHGGGLAGLESPVFTGVPEAPTASLTTNSDQLATTAFVKNSVNELVGGATTALNTLNELAVALGNDPNFASTLSTQIGTKVTSNIAITGGTATKITYDSKGLVLSGTSPTTISGYGITDAAPLSHVGSGGTSHAAATVSAAGFMSSTDKVRLDGLVATAAGGAVTSVNGQTGAVSITKTEMGLDQINNTSDLAKPVSTATQTALNLKANLASPTFTGTPVAPTAASGTNTTQIATTAFTSSAISTALTANAIVVPVATVQSVSFSATVNKRYIIAGTVNITLPGAANIHDTIEIISANNTSGTVVLRNGLKIMGAGEDLIIDVPYYSFRLVYCGSTYGWIVI